MKVLPTSNQTVTFNCRETSDSTFTITYISESSRVEAQETDVSGTYSNGKVTFSIDLALVENTFYMFYIEDSTREICRHKVFVTNQDISDYKINTGKYTEASSSNTTYTIIT